MNAAADLASITDNDEMTYVLKISYELTLTNDYYLARPVAGETFCFRQKVFLYYLRPRR